MFESVMRQSLESAFGSATEAVASFLPQLIAAIIAFLIGWLIAVLLGRVAYHIVKVLGVNKALASLGLGRLFERSGLRLDAPKFFYEVVKWFFIIVALLAATNILGLVEVSQFLTEVLFYIPNVLIAAIILLAGALVAKFLAGLVRASVKAADLASANLLAAATRWVVIIFAILAALVQLRVAADIVRIVIVGLVAGGSLAFGLAFGLGGKKAAEDALNDLRKRIED